MTPTPFPEANAILDRLVPAVKAVLGPRLVGIYLYGSCVHGAFEPGRSDVDVLAATVSDVDDTLFDQLRRMHDDLAAAVPAWADRIEVQYVSREALRTFKERSSRIAAISPGDPFSWKWAGNDWAMNWYDVLAHGTTLDGPGPASVIAPISREEFVAVIRQSALDWEERLADLPARRGAQAYAILTLCRALVTIRTGTQVSKADAAAWAERELPAWAAVVSRALAWSRDASRHEPPPEPGTLDTTRAFARHVIGVVRSKDS